MKERPILFSAPMVRAILEGRKTMTRRVVKPQPIEGNWWFQWEPGPAWGNPARSVFQTNDSQTLALEIGNSGLCPYGLPGDRLWVRETWFDAGRSVAPTCLGFAADGDIPHGQSYRVRPSIFMPRWASRILLEVTAVRVERLWEISENDAKSEGAPARRWQDLHQCPPSLIGGVGSYLPKDARYRYGFYELWDSINAKRGYGWDANPWVWVIEFKRLKPVTVVA